MILALHHASQLLGLVNRFKKDIEMLLDQQQKYDKEISRIYHEIEKTELDQENGFNYSKTLQDVLMKRRKTKFELEQLKYFLKQIGCDDFKSKLEEVKNDIQEDEKKYIKKFPLYKDIIPTGYYKLKKEGVQNQVI